MCSTKLAKKKRLRTGHSDWTVWWYCWFFRTGGCLDVGHAQRLQSPGLLFVQRVPLHPLHKSHRIYLSAFAVFLCWVLSNAQSLTMPANSVHEPHKVHLTTQRIENNRAKKLTAYRVSSHIEVGKTTVSNGSDNTFNSFFQCENN